MLVIFNPSSAPGYSVPSVCFLLIPAHPLLHPGPFLDGSSRQLGLPEGRQPDAEVRGHQVQGGAGAA